MVPYLLQSLEATGFERDWDLDLLGLGPRGVVWACYLYFTIIQMKVLVLCRLLRQAFLRVNGGHDRACRAPVIPPSSLAIDNWPAPRRRRRALYPMLRSTIAAICLVCVIVVSIGWRLDLDDLVAFVWEQFVGRWLSEFHLAL